MVNANPVPKLVLMLMTDQFRFDAFDPIVTPNLYHKLASDPLATTFTNAYVSTPICTPARAGLLTGKSPWNHGMLGYGWTVNCPHYPTTLPAILKEWGGYQTYAVGKNHFGWYDNSSYVAHGYDHLQVYDALSDEPFTDEYMAFFNQTHPNVDPLSVTCYGIKYNDWKACPYGLKDESQHPTPWTTRQALKYLNAFDFDDKDNKMFLKVSYHRPHSPYDPPARIFDKHLSRPIPKRIINNTSWDAKFLNKTQMPNAADFGDPGEAAAQHTRAGYLGSCEFVDEGVGLVLDWVRDQGLWDDTMIIWTTDHGDMNGDHNLWRKGVPWESAAHVNLIMKLPKSASTISSEEKDTKNINNENTQGQATKRNLGKKEAGKDIAMEAKHLRSSNDQKSQLSHFDSLTTNDALVESRDIAVTVYDYFGWWHRIKKVDPLVNGLSMLPLIHGSKTKLREWLDMELVHTKTINWNAILGSYRDSQHPECQKWKYIFNVPTGQKEQLFCLTTDPNESYDLAPLPQFESALTHFRTTMITQFEVEQRGEKYVKDGQLVQGRPWKVFADTFPCDNKDKLAPSGAPPVMS